jgi:hypothetical protein
MMPLLQTAVALTDSEFIANLAKRKGNYCDNPELRVWAFILIRFKAKIPVL